MENRKTSFMKRVAMFVMALAVVLTTVLIPVPAKAAETGAFVVKSYTMAKGEKWTLNVYNAADNAKISYKSSKKSVATVSKKGVVTAKKAGSATITVTVKDSEGTYQAKTKIKVKSKVTTADQIKRVNTELNLLYKYTYELAEGLGVLEDETVIEYLNACAEIVDLGNKMAKKPSAYSEEEILEELDAIATMAQSMVELVDELASL